NRGSKYYKAQNTDKHWNSGEQFAGVPASATERGNCTRRDTSVMCWLRQEQCILRTDMNGLPQSYPPVRATRVHPPATPVVLRTHEGLRSQGRLELVSLTGGLLSLARVLNSGVKV